MKKLVGLCLLCVLGIVPGASAQFAGGDGDGYDTVTLAMSFPAFVNLYTGGSGDGYDSRTSEPSGNTTRYVVATDGRDAFNNCTVQADACATIAHAVNRANAGDTLDLAAGIYTEPGLVIDKALNIQGAGVVVQ